MKRLFSTHINVRLLDLTLLLVRVGVGGFMLTHGLPKLQKLMGPGPVKFGDPLGIGTLPSMGLAVFAEVGCSILLIVGLATRLAAIPLLITMGVAGFIVHSTDPFATKEKALLYLLIYLFLLIAGPGKYSVDHMIGGKSGKSKSRR